MRLGYFGPAGTFTHAALLASARVGALGAAVEAVPFPTERETIMAAQAGVVDASIVPIENSLEGGVNATLDTLALDATGVRIVGEELLPISHSLITRPGVALGEITTVVSHPQPLGQCRRFLAEQLAHARQVAATSTVAAVRTVAEAGEPWAAIGTTVAAGLYDCAVLAEGIEDEHGNVTRFLWVSPVGGPSPFAEPERSGEAADAGAPADADASLATAATAPTADPSPATAAAAPTADPSPATAATAPTADPSPRSAWKTSVVFHGSGDGTPGWLMSCLSEMASRGINLSRIESRPLKRALGHYLFLVDLEGGTHEPVVRAAIDALHGHCEVVRVLGSYPVAS